MGVLQNQGPTEQILRFRALADKVTAIGKRHNLDIKGYHSSDLPIFSELSFEAQQRAQWNLEQYLQSMEFVENAGGNHQNQERSLWAALSILGLVPPNELFSYFNSEDVVEIYDLEGIQIWRNFNFMRICSYTLEEVFSLEWHKRYKRDPEKSLECQVKVGSLLTGQTPPIYMVEVDEHVVEETLSEERYQLSLKHRFIARLKNSDGILAAWIVASKVNIIGRGISPQHNDALPSKAPAPSLHLV